MARQYEFRPAKAAQRRMVVDACRRLTAVAPLEAYQYVGFGGLEFVDFREFHLGLGIPAMTSIERDTNLQHRLEFNKPYRMIDVLMGEARDRLPEIDWRRLAIVWLDYTVALNGDVLRDLDFVIRSAAPGSVVLVTVNGASTGVPLPKRLKALQDALGDRVGDRHEEANMAGWGATRIQREVLQAQAHSSCRQAHGQPFRQLFNFHYADDAKMLTWGGVVSSPALDRTLDTCRFEDLRFIRTADEPFEIVIPVLTEREIAHLEEQLAGGSSPAPKVKGLTPSDIDAFARVYRWRVGSR